MERTQNLKPIRPARSFYERETNTVRVIVIFHLVGFIGLYFLPTKPYFIHLVPVHLWLMMLLVLINHDEPGKKFLAFTGIVFLTGWLVEYCGVYTGALFGNYTYGHTLGISVFKIPVLMGVTWFLLVYTTGVSMRKLNIKPMILRIFGGAVLLVILDFLIEPIAQRLDYWHWDGNEAPPQNYICWFIISAALLVVFELFKFKKQSMVGPSILICQFIFFAALQ
ncbi:carotenoid biosynthesis protein [Mucilaginibacter ximonensis]|uniref:Carotenoid biosynthesis protein n=1 Tax=Mucilaginibacter ximonensis TaxID=538021 RepID=A0ABW5YHB2_9SPHI